MAAFIDTIVVGGGAMGSAAAWQLARRGAEVALLERFDPGHTRGASHGRSRNFNPAYGDAVHLRMLSDAAALWRELEAETGWSVLVQTGVVSHGRHPGFDEIARMLPHFGFDAEIVSTPTPPSRRCSRPRRRTALGCGTAPGSRASGCWATTGRPSRRRRRMRRGSPRATPS
jgi:sarcosine oxidase